MFHDTTRQAALVRRPSKAPSSTNTCATDHHLARRKTADGRCGHASVIRAAMAGSYRRCLTGVPRRPHLRADRTRTSSAVQFRALVPVADRLSFTTSGRSIANARLLSLDTKNLLSSSWRHSLRYGRRCTAKTTRSRHADWANLTFRTQMDGIAKMPRSRAEACGRHHSTIGHGTISTWMSLRAVTC
jgi:hypothetical protein